MEVRSMTLITWLSPGKGIGDLWIVLACIIACSSATLGSEHARVRRYPCAVGSRPGIEAQKRRQST